MSQSLTIDSSQWIVLEAFLYLSNVSGRFKKKNRHRGPFDLKIAVSNSNLLEAEEELSMQYYKIVNGLNSNTFFKGFVSSLSKTRWNRGRLGNIS
jgi:hypothetical protein